MMIIIDQLIPLNFVLFDTIVYVGGHANACKYVFICVYMQAFLQNVVYFFIWNECLELPFLFADGRNASIELATRHLQEETILRCIVFTICHLLVEYTPTQFIPQAAVWCVQLEDCFGKGQLKLRRAVSLLWVVDNTLRH